ncbi:MAG: vitamin K epoxide reductase family protein [Anaerolineae bacterium]|nr:vitamin K epoxide reductase family protein [Anaerolineae bacterium]
MWKASLRVVIGLLLAVWIGAVTLTGADAAPKPVVRGVLFWSELCSHCHYVIDKVLPPLQAKYGAQLDIMLVEVSSPQNQARFVQALTALKIPSEQRGVPFLVIGDRYLVGSEQIPAELPGLIDRHLTAGGLDYPKLPGIDELVAEKASAAPDVGATEASAVAQAAGAPSTSGAQWSDGFTLAMVIMVGMVIAILYAILALLRASQGQGAPRALSLDWTIPLLALVGLGVAAYLSYVETQGARAICGPVGDCNAVQSSPYARLLGIPIGVLGMGGYLLMLAAWVWPRWRHDRLAAYAPLLLFGMAFFGVLFSLYLTYLEPFVIGAVCAWCLSSAVLITLLMVLSLGPLLSVIQPQQSEYAGRSV